MVTLRELAKRDRAIAAITSRECRLIAEALGFIDSCLRRRLFKFIIPKSLRNEALAIRMLAAILSRTPEETVSLNTQIQMAMDKDK